MAKCPSYKRGKGMDICLMDGKKITKRHSTMCRKNPERCNKNRERTPELGDFY